MTFYGGAVVIKAFALFGIVNGAVQPGASHGYAFNRHAVLTPFTCYDGRPPHLGAELFDGALGMTTVVSFPAPLAAPSGEIYCTSKGPLRDAQGHRVGITIEVIE